VAAVLDDENDALADGTPIVLGSSTNRVDKQACVYIKATDVGKQHAVILPASDCPADRRKDFPHGKEFGKDDAPILAPFFAKGQEDEKHIVVLPPIVHPNSWGVEDVVNEKIDPSTVQTFGDVQST
jgi:hypothetical protein